MRCLHSSSTTPPLHTALSDDGDACEYNGDGTKSKHMGGFLSSLCTLVFDPSGQAASVKSWEIGTLQYSVPDCCKTRQRESSFLNGAEGRVCRNASVESIAHLNVRRSTEDSNRKRHEGGCDMRTLTAAKSRFPPARNQKLGGVSGVVAGTGIPERCIPCIRFGPSQSVRPLGLIAIGAALSD
ncbi:hypothetical protein DENSPDRAFT_15058 [Dentipellis sp. KUC8613]|nr:hypothetical protein DENSPDRAFT_15058 [Dentipellis sp. KUC8613]